MTSIRSFRQTWGHPPEKHVETEQSCVVLQDTRDFRAHQEQWLGSGKREKKERGKNKYRKVHVISSGDLDEDLELELVRDEKQKHSEYIEIQKQGQSPDCRVQKVSDPEETFVCVIVNE